MIRDQSMAGVDMALLYILYGYQDQPVTRMVICTATVSWSRLNFSVSKLVQDSGKTP